MVKIKTITDVITNSSSETFIIQQPDNLTFSQFKEKLEEITKNKLREYDKK